MWYTRLFYEELKNEWHYNAYKILLIRWAYFCGDLITKIGFEHMVEGKYYQQYMWLHLTYLPLEQNENNADHNFCRVFKN